MNKPLSFSVDGLSDASSIGRTKLYEAIKSKQLKARKFNKRTVILYEDAVNFLNSLPELDPNCDINASTSTY